MPVFHQIRPYSSKKFLQYKEPGCQVRQMSPSVEASALEQLNFLELLPSNIPKFSLTSSVLHKWLECNQTHDMQLQELPFTELPSSERWSPPPCVGHRTPSRHNAPSFSGHFSNGGFGFLFGNALKQPPKWGWTSLSPGMDSSPPPSQQRAGVLADAAARGSSWDSCGFCTLFSPSRKSFNFYFKCTNHSLKKKGKREIFTWARAPLQRHSIP